MSVARGGRLPKAIDEAMQNINASVRVDSALWQEDIQGSVAHAAGLARAGVITQDDCSSIVAGLREVAAGNRSRQLYVGSFQRRRPHEHRGTAARDSRTGGW